MKEKYYICIELKTGAKINVCLETKYAPKTVEHFIKLVENKYFDGTIFHRVIDNFMIQTGGYKIENNTLMELPKADSVVGEFASNGFKQNTLDHTFGVISMARTNDKNSATGQFFICAADCKWLDGEYAAFGHVTDETSKQAVLDISKIPTYSPHPMFADFPQYEVAIKTIHLLEE